MPGYGTQFDGPVQVGTRPQSSPTTPGINDYGNVLIEQDITLVAATGTAAVTESLYLPIGAKLVDVVVDNMVGWNSGTADVFSLGTSAGGTSFVSGVSLASTGRTRPTFTAAQLINMGSIAAPGELFGTVTQSGTAATTGSTVAHIIYEPTIQPFTGNT
jgi:hypothetical protein